MTTIYFDEVAFRNLFPQYSDPTKFPVAVLQAQWNSATNYISDQNSGWYCGGMNLQRQTQAINLMTAHLLLLNGKASRGQTPGLATSANIGGVSVSLTPPPVRSQFEWWLSLSSFGQQLSTLLQLAAVGGVYVGGSPQRSAFRQLGRFYR